MQNMAVILMSFLHLLKQPFSKPRCIQHNTAAVANWAKTLANELG